MFRRTSLPLASAFATVLSLLVVEACSTVKETGRSHLTLIPASVMNSLGLQSYQDETSKYKTITTGPQAEMVQRVGQRIAKATGRDYQWEFKLLDAPDIVNAFCLPGGKVAVYSGILKVANNENELAAVLGHEIAHATSEHGNERMTLSLGTQLGVSGLEYLIGNWSKASAETKGQIAAALGAGATYGVELPFSRKDESEADEIGTRFMIRAGYNGEEAVKLWEKMAQLNTDRPSEFLSTHPDPVNRAKRLREILPKLTAEEGGGAGAGGGKSKQLPTGYGPKK